MFIIHFSSYSIHNIAQAEQATGLNNNGEKKMENEMNEIMALKSFKCYELRIQGFEYEFSINWLHSANDMKSSARE